MIILKVYIVQLKKYFASQSIIFILQKVKFPDWLVFELQVLYAVYPELKNVVIHQYLTSVFQFVYTLKLYCITVVFLIQCVILLSMKLKDI